MPNSIIYSVLLQWNSGFASSLVSSPGMILASSNLPYWDGYYDAGLLCGETAAN